MPKNLLLADDSVTIQKVVGITFAGEDFKITAVDNGEDALSRARELKPDVILADVVMPKRNGYELCEAVKSDPALQHIPVLLLAGTFEAFDESRARVVRADGHIAKPFESQALINKVKELLASSKPEAASAAPSAADVRPPQARTTPPSAAPQPYPGASRPPSPAAPGAGRPPPGGRPPIPAAPTARPAPASPTVALPRAGMPPPGRAPIPGAGAPGGARPPLPPPGLRPPMPMGRPPVPPQPVTATPRPAAAPVGARAPTFAPSSGPSFPARPPAAQPSPVPAPKPVAAPPAAEERQALKRDAPSASLSSSSFDLDWADVDVSDEPLETSQEPPPPASLARAAPAAPPPAAARAAVPAREGLAPGELPSLSGGLGAALDEAPSAIPSAEVVPLEDLDFGESPFAAPPRSTVQPAPEPEPVELPMLEAEEDIELTPVSELTPGPEKGSPSEPPPPAVREPSLTSDPPAPTTVSEWLVAHGLPEIAPRPVTLEPEAAPAQEPSAPMQAPSDGGEAQLREALSRASREVIERIAWEVVPQLAETIIREQVDRLVLDRMAKERLVK